MLTTSKDATQKVLDYIETRPEWSKRILQKLRAVILKADPSITEDWKWGPNYASSGMVCGFGAFQKHVKLTFFNGSDMKDPDGLFNHCVDNEFSRSIKYVDENEIDEKLLMAYIKESIAVNKKGFKRVVKDKTVDVPEDLLKALAMDEKAASFFTNLSYGYKKEMVELVTTAKQDHTRVARIVKVVDHCKEGKKLNDKYK
jgi:hypothetical protein